jgi:hypothetical protein
MKQLVTLDSFAVSDVALDTARNAQPVILLASFLERLQRGERNEQI